MLKRNTNRMWLGAMTVFLALPAAVEAKKQNKVQTVTSLGQAVILGGDKPAARDKAIDDAQRKAVEQAVGAIVSSETITENYQLLSDKIYSRSKGYIRKYKVLSEKEDAGVYQVKIEAKVSTGNLKNDVDGIMALLHAKNMPRVLVMVAEQNIGQGEASFWWGDKTFSTDLSAVENTFIDSWQPKGVRFVDRQALAGKIKVGPAVTSAAPPPTAVKEFATKSGAEVVIVGQAVAKDVGNMMGTKMRSCRANVSLKALNVDNGSIMATTIQTAAAGHIDPVTGGTQALQKATRQAADDLLKKILDRWQSEVHGAMTVSLTVNNLRRSRQVRQLMNVLRSQVRGVKDVRQRSFNKRVAMLEVDIEGSAQDLAIELEEKKFPGFAMEIDEITANTVKASVVK